MPLAGRRVLSRTPMKRKRPYLSTGKKEARRIFVSRQAAVRWHTAMLEKKLTAKDQEKLVDEYLTKVVFN